jgi:SAM-dependent methyltransferase
MKRFSLPEIEQYWKDQARRHGQSSSASWSDSHLVDMEIEHISRYLEDGDTVLDIGCANGYSTAQYAARKAVRIRGVDYIPEMVAEARRRLAALDSSVAQRMQFAAGDILGLREPDGAYQKVVVVRVLINLGSWSRQQSALHECARVLKPGGLLLLSEATIQGWTRLNALRREWALPEIPMPAFNTYLDQEAVVREVAPELELIELANFASTYYVGTRVLKPLLAQALGRGLDPANPEMEWNRWFASLPAGGDYGTQKLFVFKKADRMP